MTTPEWIAVTLKVIEVLDELGVPYVVCGSAASITHGVVRTTIDTDLIADLRHEHVEPFVAAVQSEFYVEPESIREAITFRRSFNIIHQESMFKVDVFVPKERPFDRAQLARRVQMTVALAPERRAWMLSAEDIVLAKLEWFRMGDEVSERQWRDVLGVLKTQSGRLDADYMSATAKALGVSDLLSRAFEEANKQD